MRGYFGIGVVHAKSAVNIGTLMRSAYSFSANFVFTVGKRYSKQCSDTMQAWRHMPVFNFSDINDLVAHLPYDCPLIGIELEKGAIDLAAFSHPVRACYLLGAEDHGLSQSEIALCNSIVVINGANRCLNVSVAGSIVMWDRIQKAAQTRESNETKTKK